MWTLLVKLALEPPSTIMRWTTVLQPVAAVLAVSGGEDGTRRCSAAEDDTRPVPASYWAP